MPIHAFKDDADGYYQVDAPEGEPLPGWTTKLTPCEVLVTPTQVTVPEVVTMRQARLALLQAGLLAQVNTAVANMPGPAGDTARIEWEFSSTVERNRPLVQSLIGALGLTESQLDDLFRLAATL